MKYFYSSFLLSFRFYGSYVSAWNTAIREAKTKNLPFSCQMFGKVVSCLLLWYELAIFFWNYENCYTYINMQIL